MQFIDTHAHLYLEDFDQDIDAVIARAVSSGVEKIILPNIDSSSVERLHKLVEKYPQNCIPLMGLHPTHVKENYLSEFEKVLQNFENYSYKGVGEIGIDLYWDKSFINEQKQIFEKQLSFALSTNLPVVIHARDSFEQLFSCISRSGFSGIRGIFHAFTGDIYQAEWVIKKGFKLGIGGIITFKNSGLAEVIKLIDLQHLVLETDSPYLAPAPHRGKRNESSNIKLIAAKLAEIKGVPIEEVALVTTQNAKEIFVL